MFVYGLNDEGEHVHIMDAPKGNAGKLTCLYCQGKLSAKKGDVVAHHFAHQKGQGETCRGSSKAFQQIVFGFDYFDFALTTNEKKALYLLTDHCLTPTAPSEQYLTEAFVWNSKRSAKYLLYNAGISSNRSSDRIVETLVEEGFLSRTQEPNPNYGVRPSDFALADMTPHFAGLRPTERALAFTLRLSLDRFVRVLSAWWDQLEGQITEPVEQEMLRRHRARMSFNRLYFIEITANWQTEQNNSHSVQITWRDAKDKQLQQEDLRIANGQQPIYKIGITQRTLPERIIELTAYIRKHWCPMPTIRVLRELDGGAALAEGYFKKKYKAQQFTLGESTATEYFALSAEQLRVLNKDFHQLSLKTQAHKQKIRQGIAARPDRVGRNPETGAAFMAKPKTQEIIRLLEEGHSLREIERRANVSINTVRKVDQRLRSLNEKELNN